MKIITLYQVIYFPNWSSPLFNSMIDLDRWMSDNRPKDVYTDFIETRDLIEYIKN